jgi:CheY-like chemotaxis protein
MPDILLIMRKPGNIRVLDEALQNYGHSCAGADSCESLERVLGQDLPPDLALVDVTGFGETIWRMCEKLQHKNIPFIVLSAKRELELSSKTLSYGATSVLEKPVVKASLLKLIGGIIQARTL